MPVPIVATAARSDPLDELVFKIVDLDAWQAACAQGYFAGSPDDLRDGFIHLSAVSQVRGTLARHFANRTDLLLVAYDPDSLGPDLIFEPSRGGQLFPHLYRPLPTTLALWAQPIRLGADGEIECDSEMFRC